MIPEGRFVQELKWIEGKSASFTCFRLVDLESYQAATIPKLLFDKGPKLSGQRFSPPGDHAGLYVSPGHLTASYEFAGGKLDWVQGEISHHVTFKLEVTLANVLDLTNAEIRKGLRTSKAELNSGWQGFAALNNGLWPPTWELGHAAFASGRFDGILFPSNKNPSSICLLIFTERLVEGASSVTVYRQDGSVWERLP